MDRKELIANYQTLNRSYKKKLVFRIGAEAGFFSEYNNMILAMLYCLEHKIQFVLYSKDSNFGYENGWTDFFEPFCEETHDNFHSNYNLRFPVKYLLWKNIVLDSFKAIIGKQERTVLDRYKWKSRAILLKKKYNFDFYTYNLFMKFRDRSQERKTFNVPELEINGDLQDACRQLIRLTWRFNKETNKEVLRYTDLLSITEPFVSMHIRGGDKFREHNIISPQDFITIAEKKSSLKTVFILTDDYSIIEALSQLYPEWDIHTLCSKDERGYYTGSFHQEDRNVKRSKHIKLFASVEMLCRADHFFATFSSNPSMFVGMRLDREKTTGVDLPKWQIW